MHLVRVIGGKIWTLGSTFTKFKEFQERTDPLRNRQLQDVPSQHFLLSANKLDPLQVFRANIVMYISTYDVTK